MTQITQTSKTAADNADYTHSDHRTAFRSARSRHGIAASFKTFTRYLFGILFILAGLNHFRNPDFYVSIMPPYLPWHRELVAISGVAELALGTLLLFRHWSVLAAWGLVALLVAVFPVHVHMVMNAQLYPSTPPVALWLRLLLQGPLIAWAYWYTRPARNSPAVERTAGG